MDLQTLCNIMQNGFTKLEKGQNNLSTEIKEIKTDLKQVNERLTKIEHHIIKMDIKLEELDIKVDFSLEGHKTNTEQLNRIEKEVARHEKVIIRRVK